MAFIRRKRKGNTTYYELVENRWINGKVTQKVLAYLGSESDMLSYCKEHNVSPPNIPKELVDERLSKIILEKRDKLNALRPLSENMLQNLKEKFDVEMTYNSNAIEGNRLTLRETYLVLMRGVTIGGRSMREHLEVTNHKEALELLEKISGRKSDVTEQDILELHAVILDRIKPEWAGFYRNDSVYITGSKHKPPRWKEVPGDMKEVVKLINTKTSGMAALEDAVRIHHKISFIHPFFDGNGRLARLLMNLKLTRAGLPPTILRVSERKTYYRYLEKADFGDLKPLANLIARDVNRALDMYLDVAGD